MTPFTNPNNVEHHGKNRNKSRPVLKTLAVMLTAATLTAGSSLALASHKDRGYGISSHSSSHFRYNNRQQLRHSNRQQRHHNSRRQAWGRVVDVRPVYKQVAVRKPHKECRTEYQSHNTHYEGQSYQSYDSGRSQRRGSNASPLLGAIVGGAIGNRLGRYSGSSGGRIGATIAGAVIGTVVGNEATGSSRNRSNSRQYLTQNEGHVRERFDFGNRNPRHNPSNQGYNNQPSRRPVQHCETRTITTYEDRLSGYRVKYRYNGRIYSTNTRQHPGDRIAVDVSVRSRY